MLKTAPWTLPYWAEAPSWRTSTSSTASPLTHGVELMLVPSIWYWFSFVLLPIDWALVDWPTFEVALTPGDALTRSKNENRLVGALSTHSRL